MKNRAIVISNQGDPGSQPMLNLNEQSWVWTGSAWERRLMGDPLDPNLPSARFDASLIWVPQRDKVLLFGGRAPFDCGDGTRECQDVWEWDGAAWREVERADPEGDGSPEPRRLDPPRRR